MMIVWVFYKKGQIQSFLMRNVSYEKLAYEIFLTNVTCTLGYVHSLGSFSELQRVQIVVSARREAVT